MANQRKVGLKIEIDGEAEYKKAIQNINKDNQRLNAELKTLAEQYKNNSDSMDYLVLKGEKLESRLIEQEAKVTLLRDALHKATEEFGATDERTTEWAIKLANAETELAKTKNAIDDNNAAIEENTTALEKNEKAVGGLGDQLDGLAGKLGINIPDAAKDALNGIDGFSVSTVASLSAVAGGVAAVIKVTKELYEMTKQAAAEADALLTRSAQTGLSTDLLQQLDYAQNFLDFDGLDRSLQNLTRSMGNATTESSKQKQAFKELGVEIYDENGKLRDNYAVFLDVIDALGDMDDKTRADIIANQLFGKSYAELKPLIEAGSGALKAYTDRAQELGYVLNEEAVRALGALDDAVQENETAVKALKNEIAADLAPLATDAVNLGTTIINGLRNTFEKADLGGAALNIARAYGTVYDAGTLVIGQAGELAVAEAAAAAEAEANAEKMNAASTSMQEAVQALADKYQEAQEKYRDMLDGQFGTFEDVSDKLLTETDRAAQKVGEFWNAAYEAAEKSIQGQFGLLDHAKTSYQQFANEYAAAWSATFQSVQGSVNGVYGLYDEAVGFSMKSAAEMETASNSQTQYWYWYTSTLEQVLATGITGVREWAEAVADGSNESAAALGGFLSSSRADQEAIIDGFFRMRDAEAEATDAITNLKTRGSLSMEEYATFMAEKADEIVSANQSQFEYWEEYEENLQAVLSSGVDGIREYVDQFTYGTKESVEAVAILAAATDEKKAEIIGSYQALQDKQEDVAQTYANLATAGAESSGELAESTESYAQRTVAALESQAQYWQEYNADFDALKARNIEGIDELAEKFMDGSAESKEALAELRSASDEEIAAIIQKMREVDTERGGLAATFAALDVDLSEQFAQIKGDFASAVQEIAGTAAAVDFTPFNTAVESSFSFLTETAKAGNEDMAAAYEDGTTKSQESLEELETVSAEKIEAIIETLGTTEQAKEEFTQRFDDMTEHTVTDLDQISEITVAFVEEFNGTIAMIDFSPFTDSVDSAFSFLEDRAWSSIDNVRAWLAELSAEIDAVEARAANVNVGHNAGGTDNWRGGLTYLAENGPELVDLPQGSRVHTAQETRQILGGGTDMRETEAKLTQAVSLLGQISAELSGLRMRGRMV